MKVKVHNDNIHPYSEEFKGEKIHIEAKKWIEMERDEAIMFLGTFNSIIRDVDGNPSPKSYKKLRIEEPKKVEKSA